jgi:hypothetical protein
VRAHRVVINSSAGRGAVRPRPPLHAISPRSGWVRGGRADDTFDPMT